MLNTLIRLPAFKGNPYCKLRSNAYKRIIKITTWIFSIRDPKHYWTMWDRISLLLEKSGPTFLVQYLKECSRVVQKFLAGQPVTSSDGVSVSLINGLPRVIPGQLRMKIRERDQVTVRAVLTILSLYKVLKCRPKLKINSITDPFSGVSKVLHPIKVKAVVELLPKTTKYGRVSYGTRSYIRSLVSVNAGPNSKKAFMSLPFDALALSGKGRILSSLRILAEYFGGIHIYESLKEEIKLVSGLYCDKDLKLAKLSFLKEPAGKVRVVAIIDGWTQMILTGLHDQLQSILKSIPQDGTMDQAAPIDRLPKNAGPVYSFDLSSATDRLPIDLQCQVLSYIFSPDIANAWREVLVGRPYSVDSKEFNISKDIFYSVGQPMGALSSFNMLALAHHIIVQVAAYNCGYRTWFENYALLGDDIVICDSIVAEAYRSLMLDLGLELSPSKGLESPLGVFEFCKRLIGPNVEFSPLGMKGISVALKSPVYLTSLFVDLLNKGHIWTTNDVLALFTRPPSFIIKNRSVRDRVLWTLLGVFGFVGDSTQIGPGKTLDSSVSIESSSKLLTMLNATSRSIAKKDIASSIDSSYRFLEKLAGEYSSEAVRGFHRSYFLSLVPSSFKGTVNAFLALMFGQTVVTPISWSAFPSYALVREHVERNVQSAMMENENFSLWDQFATHKPREWTTQAELMALLRRTALGWHKLVDPILDFVVDRRPPLLRVGERVRSFWKEFDRLEKTSPYNTMNLAQCWAPFVVPFEAGETPVPKVKKEKDGRKKRYGARKRV